VEKILFMAPKINVDTDVTVRNYALALSKVKIVNREVELELYRQYKEHNDIEARNKLIESGLRFVVKLAQKFAKDLEHQKTLISAGNEGLLVAIDRFDPTRGTRFLSYATWWVILYIREEIHKSSVVSVPIWRKKSARKVQTVQDRLRDTLGREATMEELQEGTGFSANQIQNVINDTHIIIPIDSAPHIAEKSSTESDVINKTANALITYLIMTLPIRERFIVQAYYGFITDPPMSLKQIATILAISSERVRQIKIESLESLKKLLGVYRVSEIDDIYNL
jgi:RNA polymerase primary sigma factor